MWRNPIFFTTLTPRKYQNINVSKCHRSIIHYLPKCQQTQPHRPHFLQFCACRAARIDNPQSTWRLHVPVTCQQHVLITLLLKDMMTTLISSPNLFFFAVQGNIRVIRGCGYIPDDRDDKACLVRTGTHDVHVRYCACKHSLCNRGSVQSSPSRIALGATVLAITRLVQRA
jgi:hypothetical protein